MSSKTSVKLAALALAVGFATASATAPAASAQSLGNFTVVNGRVHDLTRTSGGDLLYCTEQREVGLITISNQLSIIANASTGPFNNPLRGVVHSPNGDIAVIDAIGDIYKLPGGNTPAVKVYSDLYMVTDPTDLIVDAAGNYVTVSQSPSSGFRGFSWISGDGVRWGYYAVKHQGAGLAQDPTNGDLIFSDATGNGALRYLVASDESHPTVNLDTTTNFGFNLVNNDGDLAVESNGNVLVVSGDKVFRHNRTTGVTSVLASGLGSLRSIVIAASSGNLASSTGFSAYIAQGSGPTTILELTGVHGPSTVVGPSLGTVPGRGNQIAVNWGMNAFEILRDENNNLLVGGDVWGSSQAIRRVDLSTLQVTTVAHQGNGLFARVVGMSISQDGSINAVGTTGEIQKIVESPLSVTTLFSDPYQQVAIAEDLAQERDGTLYIAARQDWGTGFVGRFRNGTLTNLVNTIETRGLAPDPYTARLTVAEWINIGFNGEVKLLNHANNTLEAIPNFAGMNYSNAGVWADGDVCEDAVGNIYTCSEDDWSVHRYNRATGKLARIACGYLNRPAGLAIAKSTAGSGSTTGWSLYVAEYNLLWEIPSTPAPASTLLDSSGPPPGRLLGQFPPSSGALRAIVRDPAGGGFYVSTSVNTVERMTMAGTRSVVAGTPQGVAGDLVGIGTTSTGHIIVASKIGRVFDIDPNAGYAATVIFNNPFGVLQSVGGIAIDGQNRVLIFDRPPFTPNAGKVYRLENGTLTFLAFTSRGSRGAFDPLTGDVFIPQIGNIGDGGGEILRLDVHSSPPRAGNYRGNSFFVLPFGLTDGGIAFTSQGDFYTAVSQTGRAVKVNRATGARSTVAGNFVNPVGTAVAAGTVGVAGAQGSSLFVLDKFGIYEVGIPGSPPSHPSSTPPGLAPPADLRITGSVQLGGSNALTIESAPDANRVYLVVCGLSGKLPGLPLNTFGTPDDPRFIPNNPDQLWSLVNSPQVMPDFYGVLDGAGKSAPTMSLIVPNDPNLLINQFIDFTWVAIQFGFPNGFATVGGTTQIYLGN